MKHRPCLVAVLALGGISAVGAQPAPTSLPAGLKPGMWEITTVVQNSGTSTQKTVTSRLCYSSEDVASPSRVLPPQRGLGVQCLASDVKPGGEGEIVWRLSCKGKEGAMNGGGAMKPGPAGYTAEVRLERKTGGKAMKIDEKSSGRWIGQCQ